MRGPAESPLRILVVDDEVDTATSFRLIIESWGHEVRTAHDGLSAVAAVRDFRPDAVMLDIGLPGMDGFEVARRVRALPGLGRPLIVAASGYAGTADRRRAREAGIDSYLVKPFDPWKLESYFATCRPVADPLPA